MSHSTKSCSAKRRAEGLQAAKSRYKKLRMSIPSLPALKTPKQQALEEQARLKETVTALKKKIREDEQEATLVDLELIQRDGQLEKLKRLIDEELLHREEIDCRIEKDTAALVRFTLLYDQATERVQQATSDELDLDHTPTMVIVNYAPTSGKTIEEIKNELQLHKASDLLRFTVAEDLRELLRQLHMGNLHLQPEVEALWKDAPIAWKQKFGMKPTMKCGNDSLNAYRERLATYLSLERDVV